MVYGECGACPLKIDLQARLISFWSNLIEFNSSRLSSMVYSVLHILFEQRKCKSIWLQNIENLVMSYGHANIWLWQTCNNKNWFRLSFKQKLKDQYLQQWNLLVDSSSSGINYRIFKNNFDINPYFHFLNNAQIRILTAFQT